MTVLEAPKTKESPPRDDNRCHIIVGPGRLGLCGRTETCTTMSESETACPGCGRWVCQECVELLSQHTVFLFA